MHTPPALAPDRNRIVVCGSLAFDHIMDFPGYFKDHILPEKLHIINISFLVNDLKRQRGGCAGNIAYSLRLLGQAPRILAAAGGDFADYQRFLEDEGVDTDGIGHFPDVMTASAFVITDKGDSQIVGFHPGAMRRARELSLAAAAGDAALAIVSPDDPQAMLRHCEEARQAQIPFVFDPSFQVSDLDGDALAGATRGAAALVLNDYEHAVFQDRTGRSLDETLELTSMVIVTLGERGSRVHLRGGGTLSIPPAPVEGVVDPTGAGDAFRAGFLTGWLRGWEVPVCGRMGSVAAAFAVERYGTQSHRYSWADFAARYETAFGPLPA